MPVNLSLNLPIPIALCSLITRVGYGRSPQLGAVHGLTTHVSIQGMRTEEGTLKVL